MDAPPVRYVTTRDGYRIAYTVCGQGMPFVFLPTWTNHVQETWKGGPGEVLRALAERFQVVNYDARGMGMSTRGLCQDLTIDSYFLDLDAVLDRLDIRRFVLLGSHSSALLAGHYAVRHPERVSALILANSGTRWLGEALPSLWDDLPRESWDAFLYSLVPNSYDEEAARGVSAMLGRWMHQEDYLASVPVWRSAGLERVLQRLHTPTLVLKPQYCPCTSLEGSIELARLLPNGRLVLMESDQHLGHPGQAIQAIDSFLAEVSPERNAYEGGRELGQALSTDPACLTPREREVLRLIAGGATNREIAEALVMSVRTVERHVTHIYGKIGARGKADATAYALRHSFV